MGSPSFQNCASLAGQTRNTAVMCDGAVESDGNWSAKVHDDVGKQLVVIYVPAGTANAIGMLWFKTSS